MYFIKNTVLTTKARLRNIWDEKEIYLFKI